MIWRRCRLLAIDTETTGVTPGEDRIVELGAFSLGAGVGFEDGVRFGTLVNPGRPIPKEATAIHGITDAAVANAPALEAVAERFLRHVQRASVLCGYNWPFDAAMLDAQLGAAWRDAIADKPVIDVLTVVRLDRVGRWWAGSGRHKLGAVARRLGIRRRGKGAHRASSDAELAVRILFVAGGAMPDEAEAAAAFLASKRIEQEKNFQAWLERQRAKEARADAAARP